MLMNNLKNLIILKMQQTTILFLIIIQIIHLFKMTSYFTKKCHLIHIYHF